MNNQQIDEIIKKSIRVGLKKYGDFHKTDTLILVTYNVLKSIFIDKKKHIILSAPTGTGKSVIGYLLNFCFHYVKSSIEDKNKEFKLDYSKSNSYMLTSSKILQEQLDGDFERFNLVDNFSMLKGIKNYECTKLTQETGIYHTYADRFCKGMDGIAKSMLPCFEKCPYIQKRYQTSAANCSVLNYAYFLNVLRSQHNAFFGIRDLTIADEAHLIPEIVVNMFNIELTAYNLNRIQQVMNQMIINFPSAAKDLLYPLQDELGKCYKYFFTEKITIDLTKEYVLTYSNLVDMLSQKYSEIRDKLPDSTHPVFQEMFYKPLGEIKESLEYYDFDTVLDELNQRPEDIFIQSEYVGIGAYEKLGDSLNAGSYRIYRHKIKDMNEAEMCKKHFLDKVDVCVYMSATIGNMNEFGVLMGLQKEEFAGFRLESNFDFSKSPIYIVNSGYLNYNNFSNNIEKIINDALYICENIEAGMKGVIHTSTFNIANLIKEKVDRGFVPNKKRYLFYSNSDEKETCIELMKSDTNIPYILIGPSLYEGLDLKDDSGRFNIIVKAPYQSLDDYTKEKMKRFTFWYERIVLEKLEQSIGRTNRHVNDYSRVYLLDSVLEKLIFKLPPHITKRLKFTKINQL